MTLTTSPTRPRWSALPRRRPPRPRAAVASLRVPLSRWTTAILMVVSVVGPILTWWLLTATGAVDPKFLPAPLGAVRAGIEMAKTGQLGSDTWASVQRILYGYGLAVLVSVPLGLLMGSFRSVWALFEPLFALLRYLPAPAFIPLLIAWLGLDEAPKITLIVIATFFFNTLMVADVARNVPVSLIDVSYTLGARTGEIIRKVIVPHSLPGVIDAVRVNAAAAWGAVVVSEIVASESGLGYRINRLARFQHFADIFAVLIVIALIGLAIDIALRVLRDRVGRWV